MKFFVGVTDNDWFSFLSGLRPLPDEVNFWQPGGKHPFTKLNPGDLFLFKLHAPDRRIAGGGFFVSHSELPLSLAWKAFGEKNGTQDIESLVKAIVKYRDKKHFERVPDPPIGCIVLTSPFFFPEADWLPQPPNWERGIQVGKGYSTDDLYGRRLWDLVQSRLAKLTIERQGEASKTLIASDARYGKEYLTRPRLGQGAFRVLVTDAYQRRCAITGEKTLPVLDAAHIKPYTQQGPHEIRNGLLLREDLHTLFDRGYLTVTTDYRIEVSKRIKEDWGNGQVYYEMQGKRLLILPGKETERPAREFLEWHNEKVFVS